MVAPVRT